MNIDHLPRELEKTAQHLERDDNFRVLRALPKPFAFIPDNGPETAERCLALVDLETTGLNPEHDKIIELAIMLVFTGNDGEVTGHVRPRSWLEDPLIPIEPKITMITGLTNNHLAGCHIDDDEVLDMLGRADLCVAHNAAFEIAWLEQRYPELASKPWACTMRDIPWLELGLDGRAQSSLLNQHGWFYEAHRAGSDVWSLFHLLQMSRRGWLKGPRCTHLVRLLEAADRPTVRVEARGAPFDAKDRLKARGYSWCPEPDKVWAKEIDALALEHEQTWFELQGLPAPTLRPITAAQRHR